MPFKGMSLLSAFAGAMTMQARAVAPVDSVELGEIEVVATSLRTTRLGDDGSLTVDAAVAGRTLRSLGEADAIGYLKLLPGVTAGSDYGSGLSVQGGDYSHTLFRINGIPLFFPYHFGGIFSVVTPFHYPVVKLEKAIHDRSVPSRVGALVDMSVRKGKYERVCGTLNVGVISSGISVGVSVSRNFDITASARVSYINDLYGSLLRGKSSEIRYNLSDVSVTGIWTPTSYDKVTADFFLNSDHLKVIDDAYVLDTEMKWGNIAGAVKWEHAMPGGSMQNSVYYS
ncbi:MAG: Plug domain-containing protein, partial [Muribaculum sp.]|nr:Plug domain-containing protein [Muribaculum sp.]